VSDRLGESGVRWANDGIARGVPLRALNQPIVIETMRAVSVDSDGLSSELAAVYRRGHRVIDRYEVTCAVFFSTTASGFSGDVFSVTAPYHPLALLGI
jgi:hypothetical protein